MTTEASLKRFSHADLYEQLLLLIMCAYRRVCMHVSADC